MPLLRPAVGRPPAPPHVSPSRSFRAAALVALAMLAVWPAPADAQALKGRLDPLVRADGTFRLPPSALRAARAPSRRASARPPSARPPARPEAARGGGGWETILDDDIETLPFPYSPWELTTVSGPDVLWGDQTFRADSGTWSLYCADDGAQAPPENSGGPYLDNMASYAIYGPFDLSDATDAELTFDYWSETESNYDYFWWSASTDGTTFTGFNVTGSSGGWQNETYSLSGRAGQPQVWIAFFFQSDGSITEEGTYVDDLLLRKQTGPTGTASVTPASVEATVQTGQASGATVTIANVGAGTLSWSAEASAAGRPADAAPPDAAATAADVADERARLRAAVARNGRVAVLAELRLPERFRAESDADPALASAQQSAIAAAGDALLARLPSAPDGVVRYQTVPFVAMTVDAAGLEALLADGAVLRVHEDRLAAPHDAESQNVVGAPAAWARGFTGEGQTVAVLDTGVDVNHAFFAGRTRTEACFSQAVAGQSTSLCPNGQTSQTGPGSAAPCTFSGSCEHGTHVAGTTVGRGPSFNGIAPDADLLAVQVFSRINTADGCAPGTAPCVRSSTSSLLSALEYVYAQRTQRTIASVNMSLGGGAFATTCDTQPLKPIIDNLRAAGIATVASSGNDGTPTQIGWPACISTAVSVGSTTDGSSGVPADRVSSFSNAAPFLSLLAPGEVIRSTLPGGGYGNKQGTSMAAPHVAGTWAVLRQQRPTASVTDLLARLRSTGRTVADTRNGRSFARIQIDDALEGAAASWLSVAPASGTTAPGGQSTLALGLEATNLPVGVHQGQIRIVSSDPQAAVVIVPVTLTVQIATAAEAEAGPAALALGDGRPNPASTTARAPFALPEAGPARLTVVDVLGRTVATLADGWHAAGTHEAVWDTRSAAPGVYVLRLAAGAGTVARTLTVAR